MEDEEHPLLIKRWMNETCVSVRGERTCSLCRTDTKPGAEMSSLNLCRGAKEEDEVSDSRFNEVNIHRDELSFDGCVSAVIVIGEQDYRTCKRIYRVFPKITINTNILPFMPPIRLHFCRVAVFVSP